MDNIYKDEDFVKELSKKDFKISKKEITLNPELTENLNGIIIIYAPWCTHCVLSKPMWENLAQLFKYKFKFYAVNTYNYKSQNEKIPLDVRSYPMYFFVDKEGNLVSQDLATENEITKFIIKNL